jgi:hypothetical protein
VNPLEGKSKTRLDPHTPCCDMEKKQLRFGPLFRGDQATDSEFGKFSAPTGRVACLGSGLGLSAKVGHNGELHM